MHVVQLRVHKNVSNIAIHRMQYLILDRFEEVEAEIGGRLEKLETNEEYENARIVVHECLEDLTKGLRKIDKATTRKDFEKYRAMFPEVIDELADALQDMFAAYLDSIAEANKEYLK